jgi:hypothetical protein
MGVLSFSGCTWPVPHPIRQCYSTILMDKYQQTGPLSPHSAALFFLFTTLYDDESKFEMSKDIGYSQSSEVADFNESLQNDASQRTSKTLSHSRLGQTKRVNKSRSNHTNFPGYSCFPSATGQLAQAPRRSALSQERRNEVKQIRHRGACLRCRFRKIPVRSLEYIFLVANSA